MCNYAVVDLEMCSVALEKRNFGNYRRGNETIQIGAVLLNDSLEITDQFVTYVSPQFGEVNGYIRRLTGISNDILKNAPAMQEALQMFVSWLPDDVKAVSWSKSDELQIRHETAAKNIEVDGMNEILDNWIDCQKIFGKKLNSSKCYKLSEALTAAGIEGKTGSHDGFIDAYNTALLFAKLLKEPDFQIKPYYLPSKENDPVHLHVTLGDLFSDLNLQDYAVVH